MARIEPKATEASDPFWDATADGATSCSGARPARRRSSTRARCARSACRPTRSSGANPAAQATVYAVSVQHRPANPTMADRVPYAVALVELDAGDGDAHHSRDVERRRTATR